MSGGGWPCVAQPVTVAKVALRINAKAAMRICVFMVS
jgi:hypothetical protein